MKYFYTSFVLLVSLDLIEGRPNGTLFRCDYNYSSVSDGWFKHHTYPTNWFNAKLRCMMEGAALASPTTEELINDILRIIENSRKIFTGIHSTFAQGHYHSLEGVPLSKILLGWAQNEPFNLDDGENCLTFTAKRELADNSCYDSRPYVCFRPASSKTSINECGTIDPEYVYNRRTKKCYKFHTVPRNFSRAFSVCSAEGGHLAIINSETEHTVLKKIFTKFPSATMKGTMEKDLAYIGFHSWDETWDWRTIHGQTLSEAGFSRFKSGQPDNKEPGEYCGALHRLGELSDYYCEGKPAPFICEKDPDIPAVCEVPNLRSRNQKQLKPKQRQVQPKRTQLQLKQSQLQQKAKMSKLKSKKYIHHV